MTNGIVNTLTLEGFRREFEAYGRTENFSPRGLEALFNYLENLADDIGQNIEMDVIAFCVEYTEYDSFKELQLDYSNLEIEDLDGFRERTEVIEIPNTSAIIIRDF
tara:strand:+ start:135 stop:452 length:318 start_codon:yes stop_codon:yes gene_type:complete